MKSYRKCKHIFRSDGTFHNNPTICEKCGISFSDLFQKDLEVIDLTKKENQFFYEQFKEISDLIWASTFNIGGWEMEVIICLNHILCKCPSCISDEKNKQCQNYKPIRVWIFTIKEKDNEP